MQWEKRFPSKYIYYIVRKYCTLSTSSLEQTSHIEHHSGWDRTITVGGTEPSQWVGQNHHSGWDRTITVGGAEPSQWVGQNHHSGWDRTITVGGTDLNCFHECLCRSKWEVHKINEHLLNN